MSRSEPCQGLRPAVGGAPGGLSEANPSFSVAKKAIRGERDPSGVTVPDQEGAYDGYAASLESPLESHTKPSHKLGTTHVHFSN